MIVGDTHQLVQISTTYGGDPVLLFQVAGTRERAQETVNPIVNINISGGPQFSNH